MDLIRNTRESLEKRLAELKSGDRSESTVISTIDTIHSLVEYEVAEIDSLRQSRIAPMSVSKYLRCIQRVRDTLVDLASLSSQLQEKNAYLILNSCKLIAEIGQPLVWHNCGKYIVETFVFSTKCMEHVINLSTARHWSLRMKLYSDAFYGALTQLGTREAENILLNATNQILELRQRESIDPPIPVKIERILSQGEIDVAVLKAVLTYWKDPDSFSVSKESLEKFYPQNLDSASPGESRSFRDRVLCEYARIQQLTAGNPTEMWKKRSSSLLRAFWEYFQPIDATEQSLTYQCLSSMVTIAMFDGIDGVDIPSLLTRVFAACDPNLISTSDEGDSSNKDSIKEINLLKNLADVINCRISQPIPAKSEVANAVASLMINFNDFIYSDHSIRRNSLIRRMCIGLWSKYLYFGVQDLLSSVNDSSVRDSNWTQTAQLLLLAVSALDITDIEDPVLMCSLVVLASNLLCAIGDVRSSISLLRRGVDTVENFRAGAIDIRLLMAEDARDIMSIQTMSFTTYRRTEDWFHSVKRLGAHAFAGCGVFGAGSNADRSDQEVADLQTDMVLMYFRTELQYCKGQFLNKKQYIDKSHDKKHHGKSINHSHHDDIIVENLSCVPTLKSMCSKNNYWKSLLFMELARIESSHDRALQHLESSKNCIVDCEIAEKTLTESFSSLLLISEVASRPPILLARSNRYLYVAPVAIRKKHSQKNVHYFRILAKELGSGTDVSLSSDSIAGCDTKVLYSSMTACPTTCAVCIGPLRPGERYVFGCAGYSATDEVVGTISPTSTSVEAVNPLPTVLLWSYLNRTAAERSAHQIAYTSALKVCNQFFGHSTQLPTYSFGKGINVTIGEHPLLCMLAIQQSSELQLEGFVESFLSMSDSLKGHFDNRQGGLHWIVRKDFQSHLIVSIRKAVLLAIVAANMKDHSLLVRCVLLGYNLLTELLKDDDQQLSDALLSPIISLLICLDTVPKYHWQLLEHQLYCRLGIHLVKLSIYSRNTAIAAMLLKTYCCGAHDNTEKNFKIPLEAEPEYLALVRMLATNQLLDSQGSVENDVRELLIESTSRNLSEAISQTNDFLWKEISTSRQPAFFIGKNISSLLLHLSGGAAGTSAEGALLEKLLNAVPNKLSCLLVILVQICRELVSKGQTQYINLILNRLPIYDKYLAPQVAQVVEEWDIQFIAKLPSPEEQAALAAAANAQAESSKKGGKDAKGKNSQAPPVSDNPFPVEQFAIPTRFTENISADELKSQYAALGELCGIVANTNTLISSGRNFYPTSPQSPMMEINPNEFKSDESLNEARANLSALVPKVSVDELVAVEEPSKVAPTKAGKAVAVEAAPAIQNIPSVLVTGRVDYWKYMLAALSSFCSSGSACAAVDVVCKLWNFIVDNWIDPVQFVVEFEELHVLLGRSFSALIQLFETLSGSDPLHALSEDTLVDRSEYSQSAIKEFGFLSQNFLIFNVKYLWLLKDYDNVVSCGLRLVNWYSRFVPEYCKFVGEHAIPLVLHSQEQIISVAKNQVSFSRKSLEQFVFDYEEAQKKKRKKKLRIARLEKDEEELRFEAERDVFQSKVDDAENSQQLCEMKYESILVDKKGFETIFSTGAQMLSRARQSSRQLMRDCIEATDSNCNFKACLNSRDLLARFEDVMLQYSNVGHFLREKKDRLTLVEALKEQGDLTLLFGRSSQACSIWNDAIDGYFNTLDSISDWQNVVTSFKSPVNNGLMSGLLPVISVLGKLSYHCASGDWDLKSSFCQMAAELSRFPFLESYGHPETLVGFAAYDCKQLNGLFSMGFNSEKLDAFSLTTAFEEIINVLIHERFYLKALPVIVILEHFHVTYTFRSDLWLGVRLKRIHVLTELKLFAQTASVVSSVIPTIQSIEARTTLNPLKQPANNATSDTYDCSKNGLCFNGRAQFLNNLPATEETNNKCLEWMESFPAEFEEFAAKFVLDIPLSSLTETQLAEREAAAVAMKEAALAAAANTKNAKGKKAEEVSIPTELPPPTRPLFSSEMISEIFLCCGAFLIGIGSGDYRVSVSHSQSLNKVADQGVKLVEKCIEKLPICETPSNWLVLYGRCQLILAAKLVNSRRLMIARSRVLKFLETINFVSSTTPQISPSLKFYLSQFWFCSLDCLCAIAERQARHQDVLKLATQNAKAASGLSSSYWIRRFLFQRAKANLKLGNIVEAESDCNIALQLFEDRKLYSIEYCELLTFQASAMKQRSLSTEKGEKFSAVANTVLSILRKAREIAESCCKEIGFLGADSNVTFDKASSVEMKYDQLPPILHNLSTIHSNAPELCLPPTTSKNTKNSEQSPSVASKILHGISWNNRSAKIDSGEGCYCLSEFSNIYLVEVRALSNLHAALALQLDEIRCSNICSNFPESLKSNEVEPDRRSSQTIIAKKSFDGELLFAEERSIAEDGLKILRHVFCCSSFVRSTLLLCAGKTRAIEQKLNELDCTVEILKPLETALELGVFGSSHPYDLMRSACIELVERYGDHSLSLEGCDGSLRMKVAVMYLIAAIKLGNQNFSLKCDLNALAEDNSFSSPVSAEFSSLLENLSPNSNGFTGRDALFLLMTIRRECNVYWCDGYEYDLWADLHSYLKKEVSAYRDKSCLPGVPNASANLIVSRGSLSTLWVACKSPNNNSNNNDDNEDGVYSYVTAYFLLAPLKQPIDAAIVDAKQAPKKGSTSTHTSSNDEVDPVLTKVVLYRPHIDQLKKSFRVLKEKMSYGLARNKPISYFSQEFRSLLYQLTDLLSNGVISSDYGLETGAVQAVDEGFVSLRVMDQNCTVPCNLDIIGRLCDVANCWKDVDSMVDNDLCKLFRLALGFDLN